MFRRPGSVWAIVLATCTTCAHISVVKVPKGAEGQAVKGFRYYLPRPYVAVKHEFPVDSQDVYVSGTVSSDRKWLTIPDVDLKRLGLDDERGVPAGDLSTAVPSSPSLQALPAPTTGSATGAAGGGHPDGGVGNTAVVSAHGDGGVPAASEKGDSSQSNGGLVALSGSPFDIVYLPDFDEQYAIDLSEGSSVTDLTYKLTNGWMLENIAIKTDTTALTTALSAAFGKLVDLASSAVTLKTGATATAAQAAAGGLQALSPGTRVLVRARAIRYAVPGIYAVLKPAELTERKDRILKGERREDGGVQPVPSCHGRCYRDWIFTSPTWGDAVEFRTWTENTFEVIRADGDGGAQDAQKPQPVTVENLKSAVQGILARAGLTKPTTVNNVGTRGTELIVHVAPGGDPSGAQRALSNALKNPIEAAKLKTSLFTAKTAKIAVDSK